MSKSCCICSQIGDEGDFSLPNRLNLKFDQDSCADECLSSELEILFVLRNLLHVPSSLIAELLQGQGTEGSGNPSSWGLVFCSPCRHIVTQAHVLYSKIRELIKEYDDVGRSLRDRVNLVKSPKATKRRNSSNKLSSSLGQNDDQFVEEKVAILRRYLVGDPSSSSGKKVTKSKPVKRKPQKLKRNRSRFKKRSGKDRPLSSGQEEEMKIIIDKVQTVADITKETKNYEDLAAPDGIRIKLEPVDEDALWGMENDLGFHEDDATPDEDPLLADSSMQIDQLVEEDSGQRTLRSRRNIRTKEKLTAVEHDQSDDDGNHDAASNNEDEEVWKLSSSEQEDAEFNIVSRKKRKRDQAKSAKSGKIRKESRCKSVKMKLVSSKPKRLKRWGIKCPNCSSSCENVVIYEAHVLRMHKGIKYPYTCELCPMKFSHLGGVLSHIDRRHHSEIKNDSEEDEQPASQTPELLDGQKRIKPQTVGSQLFQTIFQIDDRREEESQNSGGTAVDVPSMREFNKLFTCRKCDVAFNSRITAEIHLQRVHTGTQSKFLCSDCGLMFLTELGRRQHQDVVHPSGTFNPKTHCPECQLDFENSRHLGQHMRHKHRQHIFANKEKQNMCELCPQTFVDFEDLVFHQRKHHHEALGLVPFKCHICSKILYSKRNLESHVATHTKEWKFQCPHCPQGFMATGPRNHHVRVVHFNEKRYACPHCPKSFSQGINLKYHIRTHTGEKPLKCAEPGCGKAFADPPTYKRHLESHGDKIHTCPDCGREFKVWHTFRSHCKQHQKEGGTTSAKKKRTRNKNKLRVEDSESETEDEDQDQNGNDNNSSNPIPPIDVPHGEINPKNTPSQETPYPHGGHGQPQYL